LVTKLPDLSSRSSACVATPPAGSSSADNAAKPLQHQRRLAKEQAIEVVDRYQAGATLRELATRYGINRNTVSAILRRHGVAARRRGLSSEQVQLAAQLYTEGRSLASIGRKLGVDGETVRIRLRQHGVRMRDPRTPTLVANVSSSRLVIH
jgi:transposase-like protein